MKTYQELLSSDEWQSCRREIIERDGKRCLSCLNETYITSFDSSTGAVSVDAYRNQALWIDDCEVSVKLFNNTIKKGKCFCYFSKGEDGKYTIYAVRNRTDREKYICEFTFQETILSGYYRFSDEIIIPLDKSEIKSYFLKNKRLTLEDTPQQSSVETFQWKLVRNLHVHHTYYQYKLDPWQYPTDSLQTLCWSCHEKLHKNEKVPVYDHNGSSINDTFLTACARCHSAGWFPEYKKVEYGVCFRCRGAKYEELIEK